MSRKIIWQIVPPPKIEVQVLSDEEADRLGVYDAHFSMGPRALMGPSLHSQFGTDTTVAQTTREVRGVVNGAQEGFVDIKQASDYCGVARATMYDWRQRRIIPCYKLGRGRVRYRLSELRRWVSLGGTKEAAEQIVAERDVVRFRPLKGRNQK